MTYSHTNQKPGWRCTRVESDHEGPCALIPLTSDSRRYFLDSDDDGHTYIVPVDKRAEFEQYLHDLDIYWSNAAHGDSAVVLPEPTLPEGAVALGGYSPSYVTFTMPRLDG